MKRTVLLTLGLILLLNGFATVEAYDSDRETEYFLRAKEYVFKRDWDEAGKRLQSYLDKYPTGRFEAEARYWLAHSLVQSARNVKQPELAILMHERAIEELDVLFKTNPGSPWEDDAKRLKIEVAAMLAVVGREEYKVFIEDILSKNDETSSEQMLTALEALAELEPETSLPMLEGVLNSQNDPEIRKRAVCIAGAYHGEEALPLLMHLASSDADANVRNEAAAWVKRVRMAAIPVSLSYYCYIGRFNSEEDRQRVPEGIVYDINFPSFQDHPNKNVEKAVKKHFDGKLREFKFVAGSFGDMQAQYALRAGGMQMNVQHNLRDFKVQIPDESIEKDYFQISGKVSFYDKRLGREHLAGFAVSDNKGRLLAMRAGSWVSIVVLQFESHEEPLDLPDEPVYYTKFQNVFGAVVHSSRQTWDAEEMAGAVQGKVVDYGRAKAEIPGDGGIWILVGDIQLHSKERRFVGRAAVLYDSKRNIVAEAPVIIVPIDEPAKFVVDGEKTDG